MNTTNNFKLNESRQKSFQNTIKRNPNSSQYINGSDGRSLANYTTSNFNYNQSTNSAMPGLISKTPYIQNANFPNNNQAKAPNINSQQSNKQKIADFIKKDFLSEMIDKACNIGEFHSIHNINQKIFENRITKKELNFFSEKNFKLFNNGNSSANMPININNHSLYIDLEKKKFFEKIQNDEYKAMKCFSSTILNSLVYIEEGGQITYLDLNAFSNVNSQSDLGKSTINSYLSFNILNLFEKKVKVLDCILMENADYAKINQESANTSSAVKSQENYDCEVHLLILFENFNFIKFNLLGFFLEINSKTNKKTVYELISENKKDYINIKSYLPFYKFDGKRSSAKKSKNVNLTKSLTFSAKSKILKEIDSNSILINTSLFSNRIIVFNIKTFSIILNIEINPLSYLELFNPKIFASLSLFIKILINKNWTFEEKDLLGKVIKDLKTKNPQTFESKLKLLSHIMLSDSQNKNVANNIDLALLSETANTKFSVFKQKNFFEDNINFSLDEKGDCLYQALRDLYIYSYDKFLFDKNKLFHLTSLLENYFKLLEKLEKYSRLYESGDLSFITLDNPCYNQESTSYNNNNHEKNINIDKVDNNRLNAKKFKKLLLLKFLIKLFCRGIHLKKILKNFDANDNAYIGKEEAKALIKTFPIGLGDEDIDNIINLFPADEHNNINYNFLFSKKEYFLLELISKRKTFYDEKYKKNLEKLTTEKNKIINELKEIEQIEKVKINKNPPIKNSYGNNNSALEALNKAKALKAKEKSDEESFYASYPAIQKINLKIQNLKKCFGFFYGGDNDKDIHMIKYKKKSSDKNLNEILSEKINLVGKENFNNFTDFRILKNFDIFNNNENADQLAILLGNTDKQRKIQSFYINSLKIKLFFDDLVFIKNMNIIFSFNSDISASKIFISKILLEKKSVKHQKIKVYTEVLGFIETFSLEFPQNLYYITERNLLICQTYQDIKSKSTLNYSILESYEEHEMHFKSKIVKRINNFNQALADERIEIKGLVNKLDKGYYDLIFIDIYKDIFDLFQTERKWKILNYNRIRNISKNKITDFKFFSANQIFLIKSKNEIKFINPRLQKQNLSILYDGDPKNDTVFDKVCKNVCQNPPALLGDEPCKLIGKFTFDKIKFLTVMNFQKFDSINCKENCLVDSIYLITKNKLNAIHKDDLILTNICSISMYIKIHIKKLDNPLPDYNKLEILAKKQIEKEIKRLRQIVDEILKNYKDNFENYHKTKVGELKSLLCKLITRAFNKSELNSNILNKPENNNNATQSNNELSDQDLLIKSNIEKITNSMQHDLRLFEDYTKFIKLLKSFNLFNENSTESFFIKNVKIHKIEKLTKNYIRENNKNNVNSSSFNEIMRMKNPDFTQKVKRFLSILYYLGINPMSHFRRIKHNKIEFISVNKNSFITFLKTKRNILEKSILNIKNKITDKLNPKSLNINTKKSSSNASYNALIKKFSTNNAGSEKNLSNTANCSMNEVKYINNLPNENKNFQRLQNDIFCLNTLNDFIQDESLIEALFNISESFLEDFLIEKSEKDEITYSRVCEILVHNSNKSLRRIFSLRKAIFIKNKLKISDNKNGFHLVNSEEHLANVLAGNKDNNIKLTTPLDSAIVKLAKAFFANSVKIDQSFKIFDRDNEEIIDKKQFTFGLMQLKFKLHEFEINDLFHAMDTNDTDCVTEDEYYTFMELKLKQIFGELQNNQQKALTAFESSLYNKDEMLEKSKTLISTTNFAKSSAITAKLDGNNSDHNYNINTYNSSLFDSRNKQNDWASQIIALKPINTLSIKEIEKYFHEQMTFYSFNTTMSIKANKEFINSCYNKFINFLEFIGLQINFSFLYFDTLNNGIIFYDQFYAVMKKSNEKILKKFEEDKKQRKINVNTSNSSFNAAQTADDYIPFNKTNYTFTDKEINIIFCEIDLTEKKFYFNANDYSDFQKKLISVSLNLSKRSGKKANKTFDENSMSTLNNNNTNKLNNNENNYYKNNNINSQLYAADNKLDKDSRYNFNINLNFYDTKNKNIINNDSSIIKYENSVNKISLVKPDEILNNKQDGAIKSQIEQSGAEYIIQDKDCFCVVMHILIKLLDFTKINNINIYSEESLYKFLCEDIQYLPLELFNKKYCTIIFPKSSKLELEIFITKFFDLQNNKILFAEEFYELIELNLRAILSIMKTLNIQGEAGANSPNNVKKENASQLNNSITLINSTNMILNNNSTLRIDENISNQTSEQITNLQTSEKISKLYSTLNLIQDKLKATGLRSDVIFYMLDSNKQGFLTMSSLLKFLPLKFNINLTINQHNIFFNYLDKDRDGLITFEDFSIFFNTQYSTKLFEDQQVELYDLMNKIQDNFLTFINSNEVDLKKLFENYDNHKGFLNIDEMLYLFREVLNIKLNQNDGKLLLELIFNIKKNKDLSYRQFLIFLNVLGINTKLFTEFNEINECIDLDIVKIINEFLKLAVEHNHKELNLITLYDILHDFDDNKDGFLSDKEFSNILNHININNKFICNRVLSRLFDKNNNNMISITNFVLLIDYFYSTYKNKTFLNIGRENYMTQLSTGDFIKNYNISSDERFEVKIPKIFKYLLRCPNVDDLSNKIASVLDSVKQYEVITHKGFYSGAIIISKFFENNDLYFKIMNLQRKIIDYITLFNNTAFNKLTDNFKKSISSKKFTLKEDNKDFYKDSSANTSFAKNMNSTNNKANENVDQKSKISSKVSETQIPEVKVIIFDEKEMIDIKDINRIGVSFFYYNNDLQALTKVQLYKNSDLKSLISSDGQSLLNHLDFSSRFNQFIFAQDNENISKSFLKNYGFFKKEVVINQLPEEEIYFSQEIINENEYLNLGELINDNGGLLSIPELFNTDISFYIIRYWGRKILKIFNFLHQNNVCVKYLTLNDLYIKRDGREIKLRNLEHLSCFNTTGKIFCGPDLNFILCFYKSYFASNNKKDVNSDNIKDEMNCDDNSGSNATFCGYDIEKKLHYTKLDYDDYNDSYIAPDFIIKDGKSLTYKVDTWIFGCLLFHILYGYSPTSYISQLKEWCDNQSNLIFEKISFPFDIASKHFFYNPFKKNIHVNQKQKDSTEMKINRNYNSSNSVIHQIKTFIEQNNNIIKAVKLNSYSAIVNEKHLNPETETNNDINGLGIVIDMIASCLDVYDQNRPELNRLIESDLFKFDNYEMILVNKFAYNTLRYLSPEAIIIKKILIPLREVSSKAMENAIVINSYQNFILSVIQDLNYYFFSSQYSRDVNTNNNEEIYSLNIDDILQNQFPDENDLLKNNDFRSNGNVNIFINDGFNKENYENYNSLTNRESDKKHRKLNEKYSSIKNKDKNILFESKNKNKQIANLEYEKIENPKNNFNATKKNSFIVKTIIDHKIIDILIFLSLRHFSCNLQSTKANLLKKFEMFKKENSIKLDKISDKELKKLKLDFYRQELEKSCATLLTALTDFLYNCVLSLANYELIVASYVENIIEYILKIYIGEEYSLASERFLINQQISNFEDNSNDKKENDCIDSIADKNDNDTHKRLKLKYLHLRTFMRTENIINKDFIEDDADKMWAILNNNVLYSQHKTHWSPELNIFTQNLFKEALTESGNGNYKYPVIKNFLNIIHDKTAEYNKLIKKEINDIFYNNISSNKIDFSPNQNFRNLLTPSYINEILALSQCALNLNNDSIDISLEKNLANKKSSLIYILSLLKSKKADKIRACYDFKIHNFIEKYLIHKDYTLRADTIQILKEISTGLIDYEEIFWSFGNNYINIVEKTMKNKSDVIPTNSLNEENLMLNWDSNFSLINFLNESLRSNNNTVLLFADKFLIQKNTLSYTYLKEMGSIFQSPFILKTLIRYLQKNKELIAIRTSCMEIIFNLLISNNEIFLKCLDSPLCNFYDALGKLIFYNSLSQFEENQFKDLSLLLKKTVFIILEMQNPLIKSQIFNNTLLTKYIRENNLNVYPRYDLDYIHHELCDIKDFLNFSEHIESINKLINASKCWIQNYYLTNKSYKHLHQTVGDNKYDDTVMTLQEIIFIFIQIFNIEWKEGMKNKSQSKNCLVYNLVKLFEWLSMKDLHYLIFDNKEEISFSNLMIFWGKIQDFYQNLIIDDLIHTEDKEKSNKITSENYLGKSPTKTKSSTAATNSGNTKRQSSLSKMNSFNTNNEKIGKSSSGFCVSNSVTLKDKEVENMKKSQLNNSNMLKKSSNLNDNPSNSITKNIPRSFNNTNFSTHNSLSRKNTFNNTGISNDAINKSKFSFVNYSNICDNYFQEDENGKYRSSNILNKVYHLLSIKLLNIISKIFLMNSKKYDSILIRAKIGTQLGVLFKIQYSILSQIFDKKVNDINLLNNYIQENTLRLTLFEHILKTKSDEIRVQFLDTNLMELLVTQVANDYRKFNTNYKKISLEFLVFKETYPVRMEALSLIYYVLKNKENKQNKIIYDEFIKNMKKHMFVQRELINIKNAIKGKKVHSIMVFFSIVLSQENKDLIYTMVNYELKDIENCADYMNYAIQKDSSIKKIFPDIMKYIEIKSRKSYEY